MFDLEEIVSTIVPERIVKTVKNDYETFSLQTWF